ncbi:MAG TPA: hypothetical protein VGI40_28525 [Pirellulaceae bacterium]|jgi:hypothetical protein
MKRRYTVVWVSSARKKLADLWNDNPAIRQEIADSADEIDLSLAQDPLSIGIPTEGVGRLIVRPPLMVLYRVDEGDQQVRVIYVKHWFD